MRHRNGEGGSQGRPPNRQTLVGSEGTGVTGLPALDLRIACRLAAEGATDAALGRRRNPYSEAENGQAAGLWGIGYSDGLEFLEAEAIRARSRKARKRSAAESVVRVLRETAT